MPVAESLELAAIRGRGLAKEGRWKAIKARRYRPGDEDHGSVFMLSCAPVRMVLSRPPESLVVWSWARECELWDSRLSRDIGVAAHMCAQSALTLSEVYSPTIICCNQALSSE